MAPSKRDQQPAQPTEAESRRARIVIGVVFGALFLAGAIYTGSALLGVRRTAGDAQLPAHPLPSETTPGHQAAPATTPAPAPAPVSAPAPVTGPAPAPAGK